MSADPPIFKVRCATPADICHIVEISLQVRTAASWSEQQYKDILGDHNTSRIVLVIEQNAGIKGFLVARSIGDEREMENLVIATSAQRRGLGRCLLEKFLHLSQQQGAQSIFLEVRESNLAARNLYEACGFRQSGRRHHYYNQSQEDALLYWFSIG
jgi:ribosomal-protein-alanine N-acetyltransferase